jgi:hypothetical protein
MSEGTQLRIEGFPADLLRKIKSQAALDGITLKAFMIAAAEKALEKRGKA